MPSHVPIADVLAFENADPMQGAIGAAVAAERERCAKILDEAHRAAEEEGLPIWASKIAAEIRRG